MRLLLLAACISAVSSLACPPGCNCSDVDERVDQCNVNNDTVIFKGRINEYVKVQCSGTNFTCSDLPIFDFAHNLTLPSLSVRDCSPSILRCIPNTLTTTSVTTALFWNLTKPMEAEELQALGEVKTLMVSNSAENSLPFSILKTAPSLKSLRLSGVQITLKPNDFLEVPSIGLLELSRDGITELPENAFNGLTNLRQLFIWGNNFSDVGVNSLKGLDSLEILSLNHNHIASIQPGAFVHTPKLKSISINQLKLKELKAGIFSNLTQIENITIMINEMELKLENKSLAYLPSLKEIVLQLCKITVLPEDLLAGNNGLIKLSLAQNRIASLPKKIFFGLKSLEHLDLRHNKITTLKSELFIDLRNLKSLNLDRNFVSVLPDYLFSGLRRLESVSMDDNNLSIISDTAFQGAIGLKYLSLQRNNLTLQSQEEYLNFELYSPFQMSRELRRLLLNGNKIDTIFEDWRNVLLNLEELNLTMNQFTELTIYDVLFLSNDITVDLRYNNITNIFLNKSDPNQTVPNKQRGTVLVDHNPLACDCTIYNLAVRLRGETPFTAEANIDVGNATCASPPHLQGRSVKKVLLSELNCDCGYKNDTIVIYPNVCSRCLLRPATNDVDLDCMELPSVLPKPQDLNMSNMSLTLRKAPQSLENLNLITLNLSHIDLEDIPFRPSVNVSTIDFSNNNLKRIPVEFLEANTTLYLANNPFDCQCWTSNEISLLQKSITVRDLEYVTCGNNNGDKIIQIDVFALCSTWRAAVVATATFIVLVVLVIIFAIAIYRYRHEILVYITNKGLFPCFFVEDLTDANKEFDVFISYAHKDRQYLRDLLPKLENDYQQKTCVHYRDWYVGDFIPDQINRSVESSRKTIILMSANFLESTFANMEFRAAHNLAVKDGKNRLIIILLEDVTKHEKLTEELKAYFNTTTYLTWDDPKFWERLQKVLPRRNVKKFVWPDIFKQADVKNTKGRLDVHMNSDGKLVNIAVKDTV